MNRPGIFFLVGLLLLGACAAPPRGTVDDPASHPPRMGDSGTVRADDPVSADHQALVWAQARIGSPYQWGGTGSNGFDCSGLVQAAFSKMGVRLPRTTRDQAKRGQMIAPDAIRPGDLIFFGDTPQSINHVGIAAGGDRMVHASTSRGVVEESFRDNSYFRNRYVLARRVTTQTASR